MSDNWDLGVETNLIGRRLEIRKFSGSVGIDSNAAKVEVPTPSIPFLARERRMFESSELYVGTCLLTVKRQICLNMRVLHTLLVILWNNSKITDTV